MTMSLAVYEADATTLVGTIAAKQIRGRRFLDIGSQPGRGGPVVLPRIVDGAANPALALIDYGRVIRFSINGVARWQMLIEEQDDVPLADGEEGAETLTVTGRGVMAVADKVVWYPDPGLGVLPWSKDRHLGYGADRYRDDDAAGPNGLWGFGTDQAPQYDGTPVYFGRPAGYIDTSGTWIGPFDTRTDFAPGGRWYGRGRVTLADDHEAVLIQFAADDAGVLKIDNTVVCRIEGIYKGGCVQAVIPMSAGEHLIAFECDNNNELRTGVLFSGWSVSDGMADTLLFRADDSYVRVLPFPDRAPGFTPTEVSRLGVDEAQDRSMLTGLELSYISASDTYHQPLAEVTDLSVQAPGDTLLTTWLFLAETCLDSWMDPTGLGHNMVVRGTRGDQSRTAVGGIGGPMIGDAMLGWGDYDLEDDELSVVFAEGTCAHVTRQGSAKERATVAIVSLDSGETFAVEHPDLATLGRSEVPLHFGDASVRSARFWARKYLNEVSNARRGITVRLVPGLSPTPYDDFDVGDSVMILGARHRVAAIGASEDEREVTVYEIDLDQPKQLLAERLDSIMRRQMPGAAGGRTITPRAVSSPGVDQQEGRETQETWSSPESGTVVLRKNGTAITGASLAADGGVTLTDAARKCAAGDVVDITIGGVDGFTPFPVKRLTWLQEMRVASNGNGTTITVSYV